MHARLSNVTRCLNYEGLADLQIILMCDLFYYFSAKTYVVGTGNNRLNEHPKHMF